MTGEHCATDVETCRHGLVVGDALGVAAAHDSYELGRQRDTLLLHDVVVADDAKGEVGTDDGQLVQLLVAEVFVGNLDDALATHVLALEIVADGDGGGDVLQVQQADDLKKLVGWYVVDDGAVLNGGYE